jgi:ACS family hexuronate transporter-like MFS transporter
MPVSRNLRWWVAGLLALATSLSYLDRQSFPVVVGEIRKEIPISTEQYARLGSLFLLAYAVMYAVGGRAMDWLGTRLGYAAMIVWWSSANLLTGTASSVLGLGVFRFLLGMGEGGGFPGSGKAVAEWFPPRERALAFGIFNAGSALGAVVAPPLIALIVTTLGWRWVFFITGGAGFLWCAIWLRFYGPPATNQFLSAQEREFILSSLATSPATAGGRPPGRVRWLQLFTRRDVLGLITAKFLTDAAWFFFIFWLPKYLGDERHLNIQEIGAFAWIPYAFAGAGSLSGGWLGGWLLRRGFTLNLARKLALGIAASLIPVSILIAASPLSFAIVFFSAAMFAHQFWSVTVQTLPADIFPAGRVGSVEGLLGSAGSFGAMIFGLLVGWLVERHGYGMAFLIAGLLHPLAFLVILASVQPVAPAPSPPPPREHTWKSASELDTSA